MSKEELVDAYVNGEISRRSFVRRLVAGGVSLTAAIAYAQMDPQLAEARRWKHKHRGHYGPKPQPKPQHHHCKRR
jgi:hypothetical protein